MIKWIRWKPGYWYYRYQLWTEEIQFKGFKDVVSRNPYITDYASTQIRRSIANVFLPIIERSPQLTASGLSIPLDNQL